MPKRRNTLPVIAFATSLMVHAMLLIALPYAIEAATPQEQLRNREITQEAQAMILPVEVALGIDAPTPQTPTWIGFVEPEEQRAEKAEIEQAAFTVEPVAAAPPATAMAEQMSDPPAPPPQSQPEPQPTTTSAQVAHPPEQIDRQPISPPPPSIDELFGANPLGDQAKLDLDPIALKPNLDQAEVVADAVERIKELVREIQRAVERQSSESKQIPDARPRAPGSAGESGQPAPQQSQPAPRTQPGPPAEQAPVDVGSPADKESSPTSLIDVPPDQWRLGKPLAREGLTLKPRRPEFTLLVTLTASPGNPLVQINFGRDGVPVLASLVRSSGDKRVDDAILASLYRWRAEGKELETLAPGKTLDVRMRIVLNRRSSE